MGILDRFRGRAQAEDGAANTAPEATASGTAAGGTLPPDGAPDLPDGGVRPAVPGAWQGLPPLQRALAPARGPVADSGFGGRLPTWQNPSFVGTVSHAVLDGRSDTVLGGRAPHPVPGSPVPGLEQPAAPLPSWVREPAVQRAPAVPLRWLVPGDAPSPAGREPGAGGGASARPATSRIAPGGAGRPGAG
ncbi:hypothetical protein EF917_24515, partial [Streptomyces sp. WAC00469]